jgi:CheY-like chemotaxis protein
LLLNAIKYSPPRSRVRVTARRAGEGCQLEVRDAGIGIGKEMLPRVFDLFAQAEVPLDRSRGGLGIGLTVVKWLVELHGGSVVAVSEGIGRGSVFSITLPLAHAEWQPLLPSSEFRSPDSPQPPVVDALPVLVVEDNADLLEMTKELLESFGCEVETANDGLTGLERMCSFKPALAFIDIGLPGLDGYSLASEVRTAPTTPQPWLVALTGYGQPEDRQRALAAGFDQHLTKPVSIAALRGAVEVASQVRSRQHDTGA